MLVGIVSHQNKNVRVPTSAVPPLLFTDGVFNVLFKYPENVLNWLNYLRINESWHPLRSIFDGNEDNIITLMKRMDGFFRERDGINVKRERGDRLRISSSNGEPENIEGISTGVCNINPDAKARIVKFMQVLARHTEWKYVENDWMCWENMKFYKFTKSDFTGDKKSITNASFAEFISKNPLSWAMTSGNNIEYTLETPDALF